MPPVAFLALAATAACMMLVGIVLCALATSEGRAVATDQEANLKTTRSRYVLGKVAGATACESGSNGCDLTCEPIDLASSVPTFAYFKFYNITNPDAVTAGSEPSLAEVGPYTCLTAPPVMTARLTRTSDTLASDKAAATMSYTQSLECDAVAGGADLVYLFDKQEGIQAHSAKDWIMVLKAQILSDGDTVGTGGAPAFGSYEEHGNSSNYMRRVVDDAPVLPIFPHAYLPDDDVRLHLSITIGSTLQWHIASIGTTVSFTWKHGLYIKDPMFDRYLYARFFASIPDVDLSSRSSNIFDQAYSYHKCRPTTVEFESLQGYPACASPVPAHTYRSNIALDKDYFAGKAESTSWNWNFPAMFVEVDEIPRTADALSPDDFFIDINLLLGTPSPILDSAGAGGWQAWTVSEFAEVAAESPNCTGVYADGPGVATILWAWQFWAGTFPYVSHNELGYDILHPGEQGKWLVEFGVSKAAGTLPAFAFGMMPKMTPLLSPTNLGQSYPFIVMGEQWEINAEIADKYDVSQPAIQSSLMLLLGNGCLFHFAFIAHAYYTMYLAIGLYVLLFGTFATFGTALYRLKADAKMN